MARVSKKIAKNAVSAEAVTAGEKIYKTAIYARISVDDSYGNNSGTIENQILLAKKYIETKSYLELCGIYADNGYTGANFERESFQNLMEAIKRGRINCILVKDLSRFGRNYIEVGNYLEKVFPFLGVRFISINDNYDSHSRINGNGKGNDNLMLVLKNLINDIYAKDISKKCRTALEIKQRKGEFIGSNAPYGYMKSQTDKHKLVINEETAPTVRQIFQWKIDGMSFKSIIRKLEELHIPSPSNYLYSKGLLYHEKYSKKILWHEKAIRDMLLNPVYIGHIAQGKEKSRFSSGLKSERLSQDKWIVVENTHEPIIDIETFHAAVKSMTNKTAEFQENIQYTQNIFAGFLKCADCGKNLTRKCTKTGGRAYYYFTCPNYSRHLSNSCIKKFISEYKLAKAVFIVVKQQVVLFSDIESEIKQINSYEISKEMLASLIEKITVYSNKRIEVMFKYQNKLE